MAASRGLLFAARWRYPILLLVAAAMWFFLYHGLDAIDWSLFVYFGRTVTHQLAGGATPDFYRGGIGHALHIYTDMPLVQIGPVALWAATPFNALGIQTAARIYAGLMMVGGVLVIWLAERLAESIRGDDARRRVLVLIGGLILLPVWGQLSLHWLHLDDVLAIVFALAALGAVRRKSWLWTGIWLATAVSAKPWAIVILPLIVALDRIDWAKAFLAFLAVCAFWWAPFFLAAPGSVSALGSVNVAIQPDSVWHLLGLHESFSPHWLRSLQLLIATGGCLWAVRRGRPEAALFVGFWLRVIFDPGVYSYYMASPVVGALALDAVSERRLPWATAASAGVIGAAQYLPSPTWAATIRLVGGLVVIAAFMARPEQVRAVMCRLRPASRLVLPLAADRAEL